MAVIVLNIPPVISDCVQEMTPTFCESQRPMSYIKAFRLGIKCLKSKIFYFLLKPFWIERRPVD